MAERWKIHICPNGEHNWDRCDCGPGMGTEVEVMAVSEHQALRDAVKRWRDDETKLLGQADRELLAALEQLEKASLETE